MQRSSPQDTPLAAETPGEITRVEPTTLDAWTGCAWRERGFQLDGVEPLEVLRVRTRNSTYELAPASAEPGDIVVRGGPYFPEWTRVHLAGASLGRGCLKRNGIYAGFRMEFYWAGRRVVTSRVQSIVTEGARSLDRRGSANRGAAR